MPHQFWAFILCSILPTFICEQICAMYVGEGDKRYIYTHLHVHTDMCT